MFVYHTILLYSVKLPILKRLNIRLSAEKEKALRNLWIFKKEISKEELVKDLASAGIRSGDTIMIHSSLSKIGKVKNGSITVIEALIEQIGTTGNLIMPAYSYVNTMENTAKVNDYVFDSLSTPSVVGTISEKFRQFPAVKRSIHPTHSVTVHGPLADTITEGHLKADTNFGLNTPFQKIREIKGKTGGIGVGVAYSTFYHSVEDFYPDLFGQVYLPKPEALKVMINGIVTTKSIFVHNPDYHKVRIDKNKAIEDWMRDHFKKRGILHEGSVGLANFWWMDTQELFDEMQSLAKKGITIYKVPGM